jgi:plastocyanin
MKFRKMLTTAGIVSVLALAACGGEDTGIASPAAENGNGEAEGQTLQVAAAEQGLEFQETELTATAGQPITVEFTNPAALEHNWVLAEPGEVEALANTGIDGEEAEEEGAFAASDTIANGETDMVEIDGLEAGEYTYICTVPGHSQSMRGTLVVE